MKFQKYFIHMVCVMALGAMTTSAAKRHAAKAERISSYWLDSVDDATMRNVGKKFEVVSRKGNRFEIYVTQSRVKEFLKLAPKAELEQLDISAEVHARMNKSGTLSGYHSFSQVETYLNDLVAAHPDIAKLEVYGQSQDGNPLYALKLSDNVATDENEPEVMITSATHGDELITVEVLIGLVDQLVAAYTTGSDERLKNLVASREIYFLPVINPDGFLQQSRYSNGVDPNRDYPWPEEPQRDPNECIAAVMSFYNSHTFAGSIDIHAAAGMIMFPWAYTYDHIPSEDDSRFRRLAQYMAEPNGYENGDIASTIYIAEGSSADYYYWQNKGTAFAYEISGSKVPPASQIPTRVNEVSESTWRFLEFFN